MNVERRIVETMSGKMEILEAKGGRYRAFRVSSSSKWAVYDGPKLCGTETTEKGVREWMAARKELNDLKK